MADDWRTDKADENKLSWDELHTRAEIEFMRENSEITELASIILEADSFIYNLSLFL